MSKKHKVQQEEREKTKNKKPFCIFINDKKGICTDPYEKYILQMKVILAPTRMPGKPWAYFKSLNFKFKLILLRWKLI